MRGTWLIFQRETKQYFTSPLAYLIAFAFLIITGLIFNNDLTLSVDVKPANPAAVPNFLSFGMIFFAPILTMRLLAEESREGTLELLLTAPVRDNDIVFGKFLSAWFYYSVLLALTFSYQFILISITSPDLGHAISAYIGIWLYGGATIAVGLLFSSLTENQVVAAFLSGTTLLFLWLGNIAGQVITDIEMARIVRTLSLQGHFATSFGQGLVRAEDIVYYAGLMAVMLFITIRIVESHRWR
ncbi:MAG: ABC transporter permease [Chloroflexi bacterium]|nr:MAG: ABC transporter permease [Phototrophicales bacterium]RMF80366.1 MAG: ABC transporter permease [Chloroflexota bacterium]